MEYSEKIIQYIENAKTSFYKVSQATGISESTFSKWRAKPTSDIVVTNIQKIADYFGVSTDYLLGKETADNSTEKETTDDDIKFALFGDTEIDDDVYDEVKRFAQYVKDKKDADKKNLRNG